MRLSFDLSAPFPCVLKSEQPRYFLNHLESGLTVKANISTRLAFSGGSVNEQSFVLI